MSSIGSMNKPSKGLLVAAVQFPAPIVNSRADIDKQIKEIVRTLHATKGVYKKFCGNIKSDNLGGDQNGISKHE